MDIYTGSDSLLGTPITQSPWLVDFTIEPFKRGVKDFKFAMPAIYIVRPLDGSRSMESCIHAVFELLSSMPIERRG